MNGRPIGARLLDELRQALTRYVALPSPEAADAIVLWIAATHAAQAWNCAPRLDITSPVKRCGKSRLLDIIEATCHHPLITVNISPAALVRSISEDPPTLLLDEADTVFGPKAADNHEDLRGILNAGHSRNRPYIRWDMLAASRSTAPRSPWPRSLASAACPTRSPTGPLSCRCGGASQASRSTATASAATASRCACSASASARGSAPAAKTCTKPSRTCPLRTAPPTPGNRS